VIKSYALLHAANKRRLANRLNRPGTVCTKNLAPQFKPVQRENSDFKLTLIHTD